MTTGVKVVDGRRPARDGGLIGLLTEKKWNGGDAIPRTPRKPAPKVYGVRAKANKFGTTTWVKVRRPNARLTSEQRKTSRRSLPPNNYSMSMTRDFDPGIQFESPQYVPSMEYSCFNAGVWVNNPLGVTDPNLVISLINKLREKIQGSDFNAGIVLAESHKFATMVVETASKLALAMKQVRKGRFADAAQTLTGHRPKQAALAQSKWRKSPRHVRADAETVSSNWLQLQYGWLPAIHDIYSGAEALAHLHHGSGVTRFVVRGSRSTGTPRGPYADPASSSVRAPVQTFNTAVNWKASESVQIVAFLESHNSLGLLGLQDPVSVAWELVPYSFIADWILPLGDYFAALEASRSLKGLFIQTEVQKASYEAIVSSLTSVPVGGRHERMSSSINMTRVVSTTLGVPLPAVKPIGRIASVPHALNALALVFGRPPKAY